jgi:hypothetical protein
MAVRRDITDEKAAEALSKYRKRGDGRLKLTPGQERTIQSEVRERQTAT